jgi:hypothetical protein
MSSCSIASIVSIISTLSPLISSILTYLSNIKFSKIIFCGCESDCVNDNASPASFKKENITPAIIPVIEKANSV